MKDLIKVSLALCCVVLVAWTLSAAQEPVAVEAGLEKDVVDVTERTQVANVVLLGKYVFVHDESRAARHEPCLLIYTYKETKKDEPLIGPNEKPVVTVHCEPVERKKAGGFVMTVGMSANDPTLFELREIQFAGSNKGHVLAVHARQ